MDFYISDAEFDCRRALEVLDWRPGVSLREGLQRTLTAEQATAPGFSTAVHGPLWLAKAAMAIEVLRAAYAYGVFI
jgi:hypothetical protein